MHRSVFQAVSFSKTIDNLNIGNQPGPILEEHSKHRMKLGLYDIEPRTEQNWIAPNATVIGEV